MVDHQAHRSHPCMCLTELERVALRSRKPHVLPSSLAWPASPTKQLKNTRCLQPRAHVRVGKASRSSSQGGCRVLCRALRLALSRCIPSAPSFLFKLSFPHRILTGTENVSKSEARGAISFLCQVPDFCCQCVDVLSPRRYFSFQNGPVGTAFCTGPK